MLEGSTPYRSALYITSLGNGEQKAVWTWRLRAAGRLAALLHFSWELPWASAHRASLVCSGSDRHQGEEVTARAMRNLSQSDQFLVQWSQEWSVPSQRWEVWSHRQKPGSCSDPQVWLSAWKSPESTWPSQGSPPCPEHWSCVREVQREGRLESPEPFPHIIYLISLHAKHRCEGKPSQHTEHPKCYLQMMFQEEN